MQCFFCPRTLICCTDDLPALITLVVEDSKGLYSFVFCINSSLKYERVVQ